MEIITGSDYIAPKCHEKVQVIYCDDHILLINKPSGLLSVPGKNPQNADSVINRMLTSHPCARIVHRLDMATSGLMVLGLSRSAHRALSIQFEKRQTDKTYIAVVAGIVAQDSGEIDLPIRCDWPNRPKQMVDFEQGKPSLTRFRVLERDQEQHCTRVALTPVTGRSHQLRLHLAELGHPILGCRFYAPENIALRSQRLLLHAQALTLNHPVSGKKLSFKCLTPF